MRTIRNCNVAVIGGAGFLGSHLVNHLIEGRGCNVLVIDNLVAGRRKYVHLNARFEHHDITGSEERLKQLFESHKEIGETSLGVKPFYVFNYAAYPYIPVSFARPIHVADVNYMGAMKVINAAQEAGADGILQVSSAEIYGDSGAREDGSVCRAYKKVEGRIFYCGLDAFHVGVPHQSGCGKWEDDQFFKIDERCQPHPHSSYGVAKAAVDYAVQVRWREAKTPCIALRQFNCVGERETHPYVVPEIIGQLAKHQGLCERQYLHRLPVSTVRLGNNSFRDFLYAGDAVRIAVELLEWGQFGEVYNLGSETGIKMYDLAKLIGKLMGFTDVTVEKDEARVRPWEIWHLQADVRKLKDAIYRVSNPQTDLANDRNLLWGPTPLEEALRRTIKWYEGNGRKWPWEK